MVIKGKEKSPLKSEGFEISDLTKSTNEMRSKIEERIFQRLNALLKFYEKNKPLFKEAKKFILVDEPVRSRVTGNIKATHYYDLIKYYIDTFERYESYLEMVRQLIDLGKTVEDINSFISNHLADLVQQLFDEHTESFEKINECFIIGVGDASFKKLKYYEYALFTKLSYINRTVDFLSMSAVEIQN